MVAYVPENIFMNFDNKKQIISEYLYRTLEEYPITFEGMNLFFTTKERARNYIS
jgi:hypothetical protein